MTRNPSQPTPPATGTAPHARDRRHEGPRRVRHGIKLRARGDVIAEGPLGIRWLEAMEAAVPEPERSEGLQYARQGQVVTLDFEAGELGGRVQGAAAQPYDTRLRFDPFTSDEWGRVIEAMAGEAIYLVKLLGRELPEGIDTLLGSLGLSLLPAGAEAVRARCTCPRQDPCRHAAALGYLLGERLSNEPVMMLALRGLAAEQLLDRLRQTRAIQARGVAAAHVDPMIPESQIEPPPLESCREDFWRPGPDLETLAETPPPHHAPHALLRRLGPSPLEGRFPLVGLLASVYDAVARHAVTMRDEAER